MDYGSSAEFIFQVGLAPTTPEYHSLVLRYSNYLSYRNIVVLKEYDSLISEPKSDVLPITPQDN